MEVLAGAPTVTFKWWHFGEFTGAYVDKDGVAHQGTGEMINLIGLCIAKVSESLQITNLDVYYNPEDLVTPLVAKSMSEGDRPILPTDEVSKPAPVAGCASRRPSSMI